MRARIYIGLLIAIVLSYCFTASATKESVNIFKHNARPAPNMVLILADDLGWQDVKCYDIDTASPYETPNIDALALKGVQFWQAYSPAPTCAPSRAAIMSGNHPARAQKTHVLGGTPPVPYHKTLHKMMPPWYSGRMPENEMTIARALQQNGYTTGHVGKWHMAINHKAFPQPEDQGFDYTKSNLGVSRRMTPDRLTEFASYKDSDAYKIDKNGFATNQTTKDAINFIKQYKENPFFLYYAEWLVHTPIQTRNKALLEKYSKKLGVPFPEDPNGWQTEGQNNPYYCAMIEEFDYYVGQLLNYLETTEDPRWLGHMLIENTYVIFTSDNGGMERIPNEEITDNYPLDKGKISAMEGGTRVPLIITGPGIKKGIQSDVMVNGLDFYPSILSLLAVEKPKEKHLDGADISRLLLENPKDASLVKNSNGEERTTMIWHFPNSIALESTIRVGDYKLIRNYDHVNNKDSEPLELYRLYNSQDGISKRVDIEESNNLATVMPEVVRRMNASLTEQLTEMKASYPYYNPSFKYPLPNKEKVPTVVSSLKKGSLVRFTYVENGAKLVRADLMYTLNGGHRYEEWFRMPATLESSTLISAELPKGTTHYLINLIDENNFLVSYPEVLDASTRKRKKQSEDALRAID
jgi:arylsulfatase A-like enzyme